MQSSELETYSVHCLKTVLSQTVCTALDFITSSFAVCSSVKWTPPPSNTVSRAISTGGQPSLGLCNPLVWWTVGKEVATVQHVSRFKFTKISATDYYDLIQRPSIEYVFMYICI